MSLLSTAATSVNPWMQILEALEKKINRHSYDTWLKPTRYSHVKDGKLFVRNAAEMACFDISGSKASP